MKTHREIIDSIMLHCHGSNYVIETNDFFQGVFYTLQKLELDGMIDFSEHKTLSELQSDYNELANQIWQGKISQKEHPLHQYAITKATKEQEATK